MKTASFLIWFCLSFSIVLSQEKISHYLIDIEVKNTGDLLIEENITVNAEGRQIQRGIYRTFPTSYKNKIGTRFKVGFEVLEVLKNGRQEPYFTKKQNNGVAVYIGDEDIFLEPGVYTYTLKYLTTRQIGFFEDFDELYYNAIGGDWAFPIEKAEVNIELPEQASVLKLKAFTGLKGSITCDCKLDFNKNKIHIQTLSTLQPKEQLTFAVSWPKGIVKEPTTAEKIAYFFKNNFHVIFAFIALIVTFLIYYKAWKKVGVDPPKGTIIPLFDPPEGFSPAEISLLHRIRMSKRALTATIVNLAVKGHIKINYSDKKYTLERLYPDENQLSEQDKAVVSALFENKNLVELKNSNHKKFSSASTRLTKILKRELSPLYFSFNYKHLTLGIIASVVFGVVSFIISPTPIIPIFFVIFMVALALIFSYLIKAPTVKGRKLMDEIEGFKMYVKVAEKDRLNATHAPSITPERFEKLLPFAIAIGVENDWGDKFEKALQTSEESQKAYRPGWYSGVHFPTHFSAANFTNDFSNNFSQAISSASTPPGSSSGSSGGFSGGGGGGGGGGGW